MTSRLSLLLEQTLPHWLVRLLRLVENTHIKVDEAHLTRIRFFGLLEAQTCFVFTRIKTSKSILIVSSATCDDRSLFLFSEKNYALKPLRDINHWHPTTSHAASFICIPLGKQLLLLFLLANLGAFLLGFDNKSCICPTFPLFCFLIRARIYFPFSMLLLVRISNVWIFIRHLGRASLCSSHLLVLSCQHDQWVDAGAKYHNE